MKKPALIFILLIAASFSCQSQDELDLKIQYQPQTNYRETIERRSNTETTYAGSDNAMLKLRNKGIDNPSVTNLHFERESVLKTDSLMSFDTFPLTIEIIAETRDDGKPVTPPGTIIYGHASPGNRPVLDSVYAHTQVDDFKHRVIRAQDSIFSEIALPEKKLRVGEDFSTEAPFFRKIDGVIIEFAIVSNYRLVSIENGIADFDISVEYALKTDPMKYSIKVSGSGRGEMKYNIPNNFCEAFQVDQQMETNLQMENYEVEWKTTDFFSRTTEITKQ